MPSACPSFDDLCAYALGQLAIEEMARLRAHVADCEACREALASGDCSPPRDEPKLPTSPDGETLKPGEPFGRYVILELLGKGGMGAVYAARDVELDRRVAVKVLRADAFARLGRTESRSRLLREAQAMARLSHPNVVPVFEIGEARDQLFLAMELVEGETLARWLKTPRSWREILDKFIDAGRGLAAAHAAGVIHRDFKPENVLVGNDGRARVTDFGLARGQLEEGAAPEISEAKTPDGREEPGTLTPLGALMGTPAYMSPEQLRGERADARSDLFSFSTSLFEALHGVRPFPARTPLEMRTRIEAGALEKSLSRRIPRWLRRELGRGLRADPRARHPSMNDLLARLRAGRRRTARQLAWLIPVSALLIAIAAFLGGRRDPRAQPIRSVAVLLPFNALPNASTDWIGPVLSELLADQVAADSRLREIPAERVSLALRELQLEGRNLSAQDAASLGRQLGVELLVTGVISPGPPLRVSLAVLDAATGVERARINGDGDLRKLFDLSAALGPKLRVALGGTAAVERRPAEGSSPRSPEAERLYGEALRYQANLELPAARNALLHARELEPENPRILAALAQVYLQLGYRERAREAAYHAVERLDALDPAERLRIEQIYRHAINDGAGSLELALKGFHLHEGDIDAGLTLAAAYRENGRSRDALETAEGLRKLPAPQGSDPRIDLVAARALNELGDAKAARAAAARAATSASARGARELVAQAHYLEAQSLALQNDRIAAIALYGESERIARELGDRRQAAQSSMMIATALADSGDLQDSRARFESVRSEFHDIGVPGDEARASGNLAVLLRRMRELPAALAMARNAQQAFNEAGETWPAHHAQALVAQIELDSGDLARARTDYEETIRDQRQVEDPNLVRTLLELAEVELRQGALAEARQTIAAAKALPHSETFTAPLQDILLARVALEEQHYAEAEPLARRSVEQLGSFERADEAAGAGAVLALVLLGRGKPAEARKAADAASALITTASDYYPVVALARARANAAGQPARIAESIAAAQAIELEAGKRGVINDKLEAEFAICALEKQRGSTPASRARLALLAKDARARGFFAIAGRVDSLTRSR